MDTSTIRDPLLLSTLSAAVQTRQQGLAILDFLDQHRVTDSSAPSESIQLELSKQQKLVTAHLTRLRGLHRKSVLSAKDTKQVTSEAKSEIDSLHLQLQNLFYEQRHLRGEIAACEDYNHSYQSLPLVSTEEFLASHPDLTSANEHDLMIARINNEHAQRSALEEQRQGLLKKKQALLAENKKKKDELDHLDKEIEKFINGSGAVQKIFDAREQKELKEQEKTQQV